MSAWLFCTFFLSLTTRRRERIVASPKCPLTCDGTRNRAFFDILVINRTVKYVRRVVKLKKKVQKSQADIRFLTTCILYNLTPKMSRFKTVYIELIIFSICS